MDCVNTVASVVYAEARGETERGLRAVAHVILNRAKDQKKPICQVARQRGQFAKGLYRPKDPNWQLARQIVLHPGKDITRGATYFHTNWMRPYWVKSLTVTLKYKNHTFYRT